MKKLNIIIDVAVLIAALYVGFTVGLHGRAIERLERSAREQYYADSVLFEAIKYVDSCQWETDSILIRGFILLKERMDNIEKTK